jgi:hypothetical protein
MGFGYGRQHANTICAAPAFILGVSEWTLATDEQTEPFPRVRGASPVVSEAIDLASERSPTFLKLVTTIDGTDGIVTSTSDNVDGRSCHACCWRSPRPGQSPPSHHGGPTKKEDHLMVVVRARVDLRDRSPEGTRRC